MRAIAFLFILSLAGCSKATIWTSGFNQHEDSPPYTIEIQITDSTYTEYHFTWGGCLYDNTGYGVIYESEYSGDTLFVYNLRHKTSDNDCNSYIVHRVITMAYLQKGKKLYPIYSYYPQLHPYAVFDDCDSTEIDSTAVTSIKVNWEGWEKWGHKKATKAFINYNGGFHSKGKYKAMRQRVEGSIRGCDSIKWTMMYPREIYDDTNYFRPEKIDYLGPLKNNGQ
jgi:hypothetical protein